MLNFWKITDFTGGYAFLMEEARFQRFNPVMMN